MASITIFVLHQLFYDQESGQANGVKIKGAGARNFNSPNYRRTEANRRCDKAFGTNSIQLGEKSLDFCGFK